VNVSGWSATRTATGPEPLARGLNSDPVVHGRPNSLLAAEVPFRGLNRNMTKEELDLLQLPSCRVAEPGASPAEVVWCQLVDSRSRGIFTDHVPDSFFGYAFPPKPSRSCSRDETVFQILGSQPGANHRERI
jgi:hypothetical protein